jgi:hypothetical protein
MNQERLMNTEQRSGLTLRSFVVGTGLAFFLSIACPYTVLVLHTAGMAADFITAGAIFLFFLFAGGVNALLKLVRRSWALETPELMVVYIMLIVASAIPTWGLVANLLPIMTGAFYYATPENAWQEMIQPYIPEWLVPNDPQVVKYFYEAVPSGMPIPWGAWIRPLLFWSALILTVYFVMVCMMVIIRKQWVEHERLVFPLTQLPVEMVQEGEGHSFFRSRLMWAGFFIAFVTLSFSGLNHYYHFIPEARLMSTLFVFRRTTTLRFFLNFPVLGFTYFINQDIAFSLWFFHLVSRIQTGTFNMMGFVLKGRNEVFTGSSPSVSHQSMGAMSVLVLFGLWMARRHLKEVFRKAFTGRGEVVDSDEMFSYRTAVFGMIGGTLFIGFWLAMSGIPLFVLPLFLFGAFVVFFGLARIIAEGGVGFCRAQMIPQPFVVYGLGTGVLDTKALTGLAFTYSWVADIRTTVMASSINAFKLADATRIRKKPLVWAILTAILVSLVGSIWMTLRLAYTYGGINLQGWFFGGMPRTVFDFVADKLNNPVTGGIMWPRWEFTGIGAVVMGSLMWARHRFLWWPIHYLGFPIGDTWVMEWVWFSILLGWLFKGVILKYGGVKLYRSLKPLFLGLILGQISCAGMWMIIDFFTKTSDNYIYIGVP